MGDLYVHFLGVKGGDDRMIFSVHADFRVSLNEEIEKRDIMLL